MIKNGIVQIYGKQYVFQFENSKVANNIIKNLPITSQANNIGGEIYFRVPGVDVEYDGSQQEEFEIGDIVYWRSPDGEKKFSIAILYGNTEYSNWKSPRTFSPCVKIGHFKECIYEFANVDSGEPVIIQIL